MPLEIVGGFIQAINENAVDPITGLVIGLNCWDGEVPRVDQTGNPINPSAGQASWPAVCVDMSGSGMERTWFLDTTPLLSPYNDYGIIEVNVWGTGRAQVMAAMGPIETLLASITSQNAIPLSGGIPGASMAPAVIEALLGPWFCKQVLYERLSKSQLLYQGYMGFRTRVNGYINAT